MLTVTFQCSWEYSHSCEPRGSWWADLVSSLAKLWTQWISSWLQMWASALSKCYKEAILHTWAVTVSTPLTAMLWSKEKWEQLLANLLGLSSITHIPEPSPPAKLSCILFPDMALLPVSRRSILLLSGSVPNQPSASKLVFTFKWFQVPQSPEIPWTPGSCTAHSGDSHGLGSSCEQLDYYVYIWALLLFLSSLREPAFVSSGVYSLMFCS